MQKIILILLVLLIGCKKDSIDMRIIFFDNGMKKTFIPNDNSTKKIISIINELISNSDDILRLFVNNSTIEEIKQNEKSIELLFGEEQLFISEKLGNEKVKKLFFPLSGDFIGNKNDPVITIFLGSDEYFSGPYRNNNGLNNLKELETIILNNLSK